MINLQELENEIDNVLASETLESLNAWLKKQNNNKISCYLGSGNIINLKNENFSLPSTYIITEQDIVSNKSENAGNTQFAMAA